MGAPQLALDPAVLWLLRAALAALLWAAGSHKLRHPLEFRNAVEGYRLLPLGLAGPLARGLPLLEVALGCALLVPASGAAAAVATALLFGLYGLAIAINLARGRRDIDCGCTGPAGRSGLSAALLARNTALVAAACAAALPCLDRSLVWLDAVSIVAGASVLALLYASVDTALANAPRLAALRSRA